MAGKLFELGGTTPFRHPSIWMRELTSETERLRIGGGEHSVELLGALAAVLVEPLFVLVEMRVPRATGDEGRLESHAMTHTDVVSFLAAFRELFEDDARANVWVGTTANVGLLVLDEHDLIYAYGPLDDFETVIRQRGFALGEPGAPDPHEHHYNPEFDHLEVQLREHDWRRVLPPA